MHISSNYPINFNKSTTSEYRQKRAEYVRRRVEKESSESLLNTLSDPLLEIGLLVLASDKIFTKTQKATQTDRVGYGLTILGAGLMTLSMFNKAYLSSKYMKAYDEKNLDKTI